MSPIPPPPARFRRAALLLGLSAGLALFATVSLLSWAYLEVRDEALAAWRVGQQDAVRSQAAHMGISLHLLQAVADGVPLETFDPEQPEGWVERQVARYDEQLPAVRVLVQGASGEVLADSMAEGPAANHPHDVGLSRSVVHCDGCEDSGFMVAGSARDDRGLQVVAMLPATWFSAVLQDPWAWVTDATGLVIAHADPYQVGTQPFDTTTDDPPLTRMRHDMAAGRTGSARYTWAHDDGTLEARIAAFTPIPGAPKGWAVAASDSEDAALHGINDALRVMAGATLGALLLATALAGLVLLSQRRSQAARQQLVEERLMMSKATAHSERLAMLGTMTAGVAHDLRSPLSALSLAIHLLDEPCPEDEQREILLDAREAVTRLQQFAGDLTRFSRGPNKDGGQCRPNRCADVALRLLGPRVRSGKWVEITLPDLPAVPMAEQRLSQVLMNLLDNAAQEAHHLTLTGTSDGETVTLWVDDDGPGIREHVAETLFDAFVTTKPAGEGTGLGLYLCARFLEEAGGSIAVCRSPLGGARFTLQLPVSAPKRDHRPAAGVQAA